MARCGCGFVTRGPNRGKRTKKCEVHAAKKKSSK